MRALARYRSNACSGVSTFAILDRSPRFAAGILKPAAAFGAAVALTGRLARLAVLRVDFGDDFLAMVNAPLFGFAQRLCAAIAGAARDHRPRHLFGPFSARSSTPARLRSTPPPTP